MIEHYSFALMPLGILIFINKSVVKINFNKSSQKKDTIEATKKKVFEEEYRSLHNFPRKIFLSSKVAVMDFWENIYWFCILVLFEVIIDWIGDDIF